MKMVEGVRSQVSGNDQVIVEEEVINNGEVFAVLPVLLEKVVLRHVDWPALYAVFSDLMENVVCFLCLSDLLQLVGSGKGCCVVDEVNICRVWVANRCSRQSISGDLVLACDMYDSWVVPHEVQSEALNVWRHLVEFCSAKERDQRLVVCFHSEVEAQHVVTEPFAGLGRC